MSQEPEQPETERAEDISDELARKYDPERLLKIISGRAGRGQALDHSIRNKYEKRFGVDLGHVRLYSGEFAEEFNRQRNAYAVTIGATGMILMGGSPEKSMGSTAGQALLAHELTHVAQAQRGLHRKATYSGDMPFGDEHDEIEQEAEQVEASEAAGGSATQAADEGSAAQANDDKLKQNIEKIRERVLQMAADAARSQLSRNGSARRP
jgi:osmotically-inducible protein OsmY